MELLKIERPQREYWDKNGFPVLSRHLSASLFVILREQSDRRISLRVNFAKGLVKKEENAEINMP